MSGHTPGPALHDEPWIATDEPNDSCCWSAHVETAERDGDSEDAKCGKADTTDRVTADRIVACVNAMQGVADPAAQVESWKATEKASAAAPELAEALGRMEKLVSTLMRCVPWGQTWDSSEWLSELNSAPIAARAALAKAGLGAPRA